MTDSEPQFDPLWDTRLTPYFVSASPAWLFELDPIRLVWTNAAGAMLLGALSPSELATRPIAATHLMARHVARLAGNLPRSQAPRLERLRGIAGGLGRVVVCACQRILLDAGTPAVLIGALEKVAAAIPLAERVRREMGNVNAPIAVFAADGALIHASPEVARRLSGATRLAEIGSDELRVEACHSGHARGDTAVGKVDIARVGAPEGTVLLARFALVADHRLGTGMVATTERVGKAATPGGNPVTAAAKERRHPLRFVWRIDPESRFTLDSEEFATMMGERTIGLIGKPWRRLALELGLDPDHRVEQAVASQETFSGLTVYWPVGAGGTRVPVELSGLPMFDRDREFRGYRGFGICRSGDKAETIRDATPHATETKLSANHQAAGGQPMAPKTCPPTPIPDPRPQLTLVPRLENVLPFRAGPPVVDRRPALNPVESPAGEAGMSRDSPAPRASVSNHREAAGLAGIVEGASTPAPIPSAFATPHPRGISDRSSQFALDELPIPVLVCRGKQLIYVNDALLGLTGYADCRAIEASGGLEHLVPNVGITDHLKFGQTSRPLAIVARSGETIPAEGRLVATTWGTERVCVLVVFKRPNGDQSGITNAALRRSEAESRELRSILDTATDGVVIIERDGRIVAMNRSAEALFGYETHELAGAPFVDLFAPESHRAALDYLDGLALNGVASVLNDGREVIGWVRQGGLIPLFMTMGRIADGTEKFCAVFRDISQWKRAEEDLLNAKRQAERASSAKSDFLAKISHEIRTPLNAIIGFSEVMMDERFGPVGNERYREYLKDIHTSGGHLVSLINDLLDLSKIEAGKLDLTFASVNLNDLVQQCVAIMQPQANRQHIIIRTSVAASLPPVVVDARSIRQIVLNLLSNSIKFTVTGGQVIVSTALTELGEAVLRVRDTGIGMTEKEIEAALEPFRQLATSTRWGSGGTGLGLPLTKALAEANRASFAIKSAVNAGTLVEITFPATRVLAE
jgi:PAS domain S-box-containing protein